MVLLFYENYSVNEEKKLNVAQITMFVSKWVEKIVVNRENSPFPTFFFFFFFKASKEENFTNDSGKMSK